MLSAKGLLESKPKAGTRIRDRSSWNLLDPDLLAWMFEGEPPAGFVHNLFYLRMIIEPAAAELAATLRTPRHLSRMGHALEQMQEHGLASVVGQAADQSFHNIILEATGNELLISLAGTIGAFLLSLDELLLAAAHPLLGAPGESAFVAIRASTTVTITTDNAATP